MVAYYWMGKPDITSGQVITPQDIGFCSRVLTKPVVVQRTSTGSYAPTDYAPIALLETIFELVRLKDFPTKPCRFESLFLWDNESWARQYHNNVPYAGLYLVEIAMNEQVFRGDYDLITNFRFPDTVEHMTNRARRYWEGEIQSKYEVVLKGTIEIVSRIF